jgi:hypothetical protein
MAKADPHTRNARSQWRTAINQGYFDLPDKQVCALIYIYDYVYGSGRMSIARGFFWAKTDLYRLFSTNSTIEQSAHGLARQKSL